MGQSLSYEIKDHADKYYFPSSVATSLANEIAECRPTYISKDETGRAEKSLDSLPQLFADVAYVNEYVCPLFAQDVPDTDRIDDDDDDIATPPPTVTLTWRFVVLTRASAESVREMAAAPEVTADGESWQRWNSVIVAACRVPLSRLPHAHSLQALCARPFALTPDEFYAVYLEMLDSSAAFSAPQRPREGPDGFEMQARSPPPARNPKEDYDFDVEEETKRAQEAGDLCLVCMDRPVDTILLCSHAFCSQCLEVCSSIRDVAETECPMKCQSSTEHGGFAIVNTSDLPTAAAAVRAHALAQLTRFITKRPSIAPAAPPELPGLASFAPSIRALLPSQDLNVAVAAAAAAVAEEDAADCKAAAIAAEKARKGGASSREAGHGSDSDSDSDSE